MAMTPLLLSHSPSSPCYLRRSPTLIYFYYTSSSSFLFLTSFHLHSQKQGQLHMALSPFSSPVLTHMMLGLLLLLAVAPTATTAQSLFQICPASGANYTANSTYQSNLYRVLDSLAANGSATGFFNDTAGERPDRVYGLVLCRGDVAAGPCGTCLATASQDIVQGCPLKRAAVIWYDNCMLRYSNLVFFSLPRADGLQFYMWNTGNLTTKVAQFNGQRDLLLEGLVRYAVSNRSARLFATGDADYADPSNPKIYGLVQCTRDLSAGDCSACLRGIIRPLPARLSGSKGGRVVSATCNFRYEFYSFYNSSVMVSVPLPANGTPPTAVLQPPTSAPPAQENKKNSTGTILAIAIPLGVAVALISVVCVCFYRRRATKRTIYRSDSPEIAIESLLFDLPTLRDATGNFSHLNKLGEGGFGSVYKGLLPDGQEIAVKRLSAGSGQGVEELKNEVVLLAKLQHRNLVRLLGVCLEGEEKLLVYEYVPNRSLDTFLFDPTRVQQLDWERRYKIIRGTARGLQYLHEESQVKIIHRDLKASNILLDVEMNPKISDFGLARLVGVDQTQASTTRVVGTYGYMAPEYAMRGHFSNKSDVFSFGVLVLEIVTGQKNSNFSNSGSSTDLLSWVWERWTNGTVMAVIDPSLGGQYQRSELVRCIQIGLLCVQEAPANRPSMSSVVLMLSSHSISLQVPSRPAFFMEYTQPDWDVVKNNLDSSPSAQQHKETSTKSVPYSLNEVSITEIEPR